MGVLWAIVAQLAKLHLQEFIKDCQQPKRFLYLCTFPVLQPVQHYLDGVCSYRSWIIKFTRASTQKENHLRSLEKAPSTRFLATFSAQALSFLSSILSLFNPLAHLWLKSLEEGYWSGSRKSTKHSGRREDSRRRLTGVKPVENLQP